MDLYFFFYSTLYMKWLFYLMQILYYIIHTIYSLEMIAV